MNLDEFWNFIDAAQASGFENDELRDHMKAMLEPQANSELIDFTNIYHQQIDRLCTWRIWNAISLINGGVSDDSFFYFRDYLVSRGRTHFERIANDPESLLDDELDSEFHEWPYFEVHFRSAAMNVFEDRNNKEFPWTHKWKSATGKSINYENDDEIRSSYPKIWKHLQNVRPR